MGRGQLKTMTFVGHAAVLDHWVACCLLAVYQEGLLQSWLK